MRDHSPIDAVAELLAFAPEIVFVFTSDGRYLYINHAAAAFLGDDPVEVIGCHWRELDYPPEVMEPLQQRIEQVAATGIAMKHRKRSSPQRGSRLLDMSLTPLFSDAGQVYAVLVIAHDVTDIVEHGFQGV